MIMIIKFSGFFPGQLPDSPSRQLKQSARRASHLVGGCDDRVGPIVRYERYGRVYQRPLTHRLCVFGVKAPTDGKGGEGFAGLAKWAFHEDSGLGEVRVDMEQARRTKAGEWIIQFAREVILAGGWKIEEETGTPQSCS